MMSCFYLLKLQQITYYRSLLFSFSFFFSPRIYSLCSFQGSLVGSSGLEPPTSRLSGVRSNHLSYAPISSGGDEEDRTPDPLRARQVLSQLSYTPIFSPPRDSSLPSKSLLAFARSLWFPVLPATAFWVSGCHSRPLKSLFPGTSKLNNIFCAFSQPSNTSVFADRTFRFLQADTP